MQVTRLGTPAVDLFSLTIGPVGRFIWNIFGATGRLWRLQTRKYCKVCQTWQFCNLFTLCPSFYIFVHWLWVPCEESSWRTQTASYLAVT
jgi:hypothetical protein